MGWGEEHRPAPGVLIPSACHSLADAAAAFLDHPTGSRREALEQALRLFDAGAAPNTAAGRRDALRRRVAAARGIPPGLPARR